MIIKKLLLYVFIVVHNNKCIGKSMILSFKNIIIRVGVTSYFETKLSNTMQQKL